MDLVFNTNAMALRGLANGGKWSELFFGSLNSRSDEGIASTATAPQVLWGALLPFLTQSNSTTGIGVDGHSDPNFSPAPL